jgi:hypothetical protein
MEEIAAMSDLNTNESNSLVPVPFGTAASVFDDLVNRYRGFAKKSAENTIKLGETLLEAKQTLSDQRLKDFCHEVDLKYGGSTFRKFLKIGKEASRFEPFNGSTPVAWTTIHKLATLEKDKFDTVAHSDRFGPTMTERQVRAIVDGDGTSNNRPRRSLDDCCIDLCGLDDATILEFRGKLIALADEYGVKCSFNARIKALVSMARVPLPVNLKDAAR